MDFDLDFIFVGFIQTPTTQRVWSFLVTHTCDNFNAIRYATLSSMCEWTSIYPIWGSVIWLALVKLVLDQSASFKANFKATRVHSQAQCCFSFRCCLNELHTKPCTICCCGCWFTFYYLTPWWQYDIMSLHYKLQKMKENEARKKKSRDHLTVLKLLTPSPITFNVR